MNTTIFEATITGLESYDHWKMAAETQQEIFNSIPFDIDTNSPEQLKLQLDYLNQEIDQSKARQALMLEIAGLDEIYMPVTHKLGALAAFIATNKPLSTKYLDSGRVMIRGFDDIFRSTGNNPNSNPLKLASQISKELVRIENILDTDQNVPVALVWHYQNFDPELSYKDVTLGKLTRPRQAFYLETPRIDEIDGVKVLNFSVPTRLTGVSKVRDVNTTANNKSVDSPAITSLVELGVPLRNPTTDEVSSLYIGLDDVADLIKEVEPNAS